MCMPEFSPNFCPECGEKLVTREVEDRKRLWCVSCEKVEWLNPSVCAGMLIKRGKEFLLQKRGIWPRKGTWSIPGGYLELEEAPMQAAKRETLEETGLRITGEPKFIDHLNIENPDGNRVVVVVYLIDYTETEGKLNIEESEVEEARFWSKQEIFSNKQKLEHEAYLDLIEKEINER